MSNNRTVCDANSCKADMVCADREREGRGETSRSESWELPTRPGYLMCSVKDEETLIVGSWQWGHLGQQPEVRGAEGGGRGVLGDEEGVGQGQIMPSKDCAVGTLGRGQRMPRFTLGAPSRHSESICWINQDEALLAICTFPLTPCRFFCSSRMCILMRAGSRACLFIRASEVWYLQVQETWIGDDVLWDLPSA